MAGLSTMREVVMHARMGKERAAAFVGRGALLEQGGAFVRRACERDRTSAATGDASTNAAPLLYTGESGVGKSLGWQKLKVKNRKTTGPPQLTAFLTFISRQIYILK